MGRINSETDCDPTSHTQHAPTSLQCGVVFIDSGMFFYHIAQHIQFTTSTLPCFLITSPSTYISLHRLWHVFLSRHPAYTIHYIDFLMFFDHITQHIQFTTSTLACFLITSPCIYNSLHRLPHVF